MGVTNHLLTGMILQACSIFGIYVFATNQQSLNQLIQDMPINQLMWKVSKISHHLSDFKTFPKSGTKLLVPQITLNFPSSWGCPLRFFPAKKAKHSGRVGKCESPDHQHHKYEVPERKLLEHSKSKVMMLPFVHPPPDKIQKIISFFGAPWVWDRGAGGREMRHTFFISANQILNKSTEKL